MTIPKDRLTIVDAETGDELAQLGMRVESRRTANVCRECKHFIKSQYPYPPVEDMCAAYSGHSCRAKNHNADCELWTPGQSIARRDSSSSALAGQTALVWSYVAIAISVFAAVLTILGRCA